MPAAAALTPPATIRTLLRLARPNRCLIGSDYFGPCPRGTVFGNKEIMIYSTGHRFHCSHRWARAVVLYSSRCHPYPTTKCLNCLGSGPVDSWVCRWRGGCSRANWFCFDPTIGWLLSGRLTQPDNVKLWLGPKLKSLIWLTRP